MAKVQFNCRLPEEVLALINGEVERLQGESEKKISQADVVSLAMVRWCSGEVAMVGETSDRREAAESAMREVESKPAEKAAPVVNRRSESVAQRKARESKEHAAALAESDVLAKATGRTDIEYDLENVPHRSVIHGVGNVLQSTERPHYEVQARKVKALTRPHGNTEPKRRREQ